MIIHGGKGDRSEKLIETIKSLPPEIRARLAFENDENAYSAADILKVCLATGQPMVFDSHHHICHEQLDSYDDTSVTEMLEAARTTWPHPEWQLVHLSNGKESFNDRRHSDLITTVPTSYNKPIWVEVEAKGKEQAIRQLRELWPIAA